MMVVVVLSQIVYCILSLVVISLDLCLAEKGGLYHVTIEMNSL